MRSAPTNVLVKAIGVLLLLVAFVGLSLSAGATRASAATQGDQIAAFAASQANVPYCDGGGGINGPTNGGVVEAGMRAGRQGIRLHEPGPVRRATRPPASRCPGNGTQPKGVGTFIAPQATIAEDTADLLPGDAVFWGGGGIDSFAHSGIYAGSGNVWDAIGVNQPVQTHTMTYLSTVYSYDGAMRFWARQRRTDHHIRRARDSRGRHGLDAGRQRLLVDRCRRRRVGPRLRRQLRVDGRPPPERPHRPHRVDPGRRRLLAGGLRRGDLLLRRRSVLRLHGRSAPQRPGRGHRPHPGRRRLLAGGLRRGDLLVR